MTCLFNPAHTFKPMEFTKSDDIFQDNVWKNKITVKYMFIAMLGMTDIQKSSLGSSFEK